MAEAGMITIVAPLPLDKRVAAQAILEGWGNLAAPDLARRLATTSIHFISGHALDLGDGEARLYIEISADGADDARILDDLARVMEGEWRALLACATGAAPDSVADYLLQHRVALGIGRGMALGLPFRGVPGATVEAIRRQDGLSRFVTDMLGRQPAHRSALDRIAAVREALREDGRFGWTTEPPAWPAPVAPQISTLNLVTKLAPGLIVTFLGRALLLASLFALAMATTHYLLWRPVLDQIGWVRAALTVLMAFLGAGLLGLLGVLLWVGSVVYRLTRLEATDPAEDHAPDPHLNSAMFARENQGAQNHMISITTRKPGGIRLLTTRLTFWAIAGVSALKSRPGFLGAIGTIHFARWVTFPGTDKLVFTSNYGGSWESYLEDFITLAHNGLTAVWSNSVNFPRTRLLFQKGATDGERFKRYARRSMVPTAFWYSAYPHLTTANIRANAEIHRGLATARTEDEARDWLALFGSAVRPTPKLQTDEIQSLIFGGLGFLHNATLLSVDLSADRAEARGCLAELAPFVAYNDGKRFDGVDVITLAISANGLTRLGLDERALATFPIAFTGGMTGPGRDRILGDTGANGKTHWAWGADGESDLAIIVFGPGDALQRPALASRIEEIVRRRGGVVRREIPFDCAESGQREPFGFADGISQPVIRDTYRALRSSDPLHVVEPGEFILGYPDNRGNLPPGPVMDAARDPGQMLPLAHDPVGVDGAASSARPRAFAQNGSFLVLRQLAQDVAGFQRYCDEEAARLAGRIGPPYAVTPDFIAAKLVGRWPNGASLVRHPYDPDERRDAPLQRSISNPQAGGAIPAAPPRHGARGDNDFLYGTEDPQALRCPFGAHTRRANPRDSLNPGSQDQIDISNRHRILRVGRRYTDADGQGLMFMCLNGDLERQFEFIQQTWLGSPSFHGLSCEQDALVGSGDASCNGYTVPTHDGPVRLSPLSRFVTMRGGGYFFLPSRSLLAYLSSGASGL